MNICVSAVNNGILWGTEPLVCGRAWLSSWHMGNQTLETLWIPCPAMNFQCTLWKTLIAIENSHLSLIDPLDMVISYSYVSLSEGQFLQTSWLFSNLIIIIWWACGYSSFDQNHTGWGLPVIFMCCYTPIDHNLRVLNVGNGGMIYSNHE